MSLLTQAATLLMENLGGEGSGLNLESVTSGLSSLLPTDAAGELDLQSIISMFSEQGLGSLVASFLGDGENGALDIGNIVSMLGEGKIAEFAGGLGLPTENVTNGLAETLPQLIDQQSQGGSLLESAGKSIVSGLASKFFG